MFLIKGNKYQLMNYALRSKEKVNENRENRVKTDSASF